ncbi:MAG: hypothetical protein JWO59_2920 [Chloroflexi bacterium]|jgi:hypothetical protein|nr:hypothetical protein [Chloroflexota bacterium]
MNALNRVLVLLLLLTLLAAALMTAGLATGLLAISRVRQAWPYSPITAIAHDLAKLGPDRAPAVIIGSVIVAIVAIVLLVRELTPPPRRARTLLLPKGGQGRTEVAYGTLDELVEHSAQSVAGVERARARVDPTKEALQVRLQAVLSPYIELATAGPAIEQSVKGHLERFAGLPVREVRVRVTLQDERARRQVR